LPSNGLHTNGYSLVRKIFNIGVGGDSDEERSILKSNYPGFESTLADALFEPHRSYLNDLRPLLHSAPGTQHSALRGIAHITCRGIPGNVPRILPAGPGARIDRASWRVPAIFRLIQERGGIDKDEMYRAFNMGLGLVLAVRALDADAILAQLPDAWVCGEVVAGKGVEWAT
jgi:phosphoribosylformylglycinamidine cyclo-ligase